MNYFKFFYEAVSDWINSDMGYYAAAFSYYTPLALIPLVLLSIAILGFFYGPLFVKSLFLSWGTVLGDDLLVLITEAVQNLDVQSQAYSLPVLAIVFFSSMTLFSLNVLAVGFSRLWKLENSGLRSFISRTLRSIVFIIILQAYFFVLIGLNGLVTVLKIPSGKLLSSIFLIISMPTIFFLLFKFLVSQGPSWRACLLGGVVTSLLFMSTKSLVSFYLKANPALNIFGAAGLILILLVWIYVLAAVIYFGASVAGVYDRMNIIKTMK